MDALTRGGPQIQLVLACEALNQALIIQPLGWLCGTRPAPRKLAQIFSFLNALLRAVLKARRKVSLEIWLV